jgi:hypothetical protein
LVLTHEEIAEMIGTSRETVSRLFSDFMKNQCDPIEGLHSGDSQQVRARRNGTSLNRIKCSDGQTLGSQGLKGKAATGDFTN